MPYQLELTNGEEEEIEGQNGNHKAFGKDVFLDNLPSNCRVYLWYYGGTSPNKDLAKRLKDLGKITGDNLFVNLATPRDPRYYQIAAKFMIKTFPTIIITANSDLASPPEKPEKPEKPETAYVKIDNKTFLSSTDSAYDCVEKIFNLFIQEKIADALRERKREVLLARVRNFLNEALKGITGFLKEWDVSFSFINGTLGLKYRGKDNG